MSRSKKKTLKEGFIESASNFVINNNFIERIIKNRAMFEETNPFKAFPYKLGKYITDVKAIIDEELGKYKEQVHDFFSKLFLGK
ncbi:hypothetical protein LCGC14_0741890 [marine sediment metagenome]|uniref:Uncharacterized protein n=2 Tax=marine sediment metagenome TaxID=412755 RepID=A0A0F9Q6I6_9ZZZZ